MSQCPDVFVAPTQEQASSLEPSHTMAEFITIPDLFSSVMAVRPNVNPHYHEVKPNTLSWIKKIYQGDDKWAAKMASADYAYMAAIWAPSCDGETLEMIVDYCFWIFAFDDQFDEGHLRHDPTAAQEEIDMTLAVFEDHTTAVAVEDNAFRYVFQWIWSRFRKTSSKDMQEQYKQMHMRFFDSLLQQVQINCAQQALSREADDFMEMRRANSGVYPIIILASHSLGNEVPMEVYNHPSLQECIRISAEMVVLHNDILSHKKDVALDVDHNLLKLLMAKGLSAQQAVDKMGTMLDDCYRRWYIALAGLPVWGEKIDREVLKFIDACRNVALGCLYWSFKTSRYMGSDDEAIKLRRTRLLKLSSR